VSTGPFRAAYADAFRGYLIEPGERTLRAAYELGRQAVVSELSVLDLGLVHHDVLASELDGLDPEEVGRVVREAGGFYIEALSAFEMVQRGFREARASSLLERRHAEMLRQLSNFLADGSLALDASGSLEEMLRLVAEQGRELTGAERCLATVTLPGPRLIEAASRGEADGPEPPALGEAGLSALLTALDGGEIGSIQLFDKREGEFMPVDEAVLIHLAQMAAAAVERAWLYQAGS
jgi:GAF domain-containing protein